MPAPDSQPLVDRIATIIDYAAFYSGSGNSAQIKARRRSARDSAREILKLLGKELG